MTELRSRSVFAQDVHYQTQLTKSSKAEMWKYEPFLLPHTAPSLKPIQLCKSSHWNNWQAGRAAETVGKEKKKPSSLTIQAKINPIERGGLVVLAGSRLIGSGPQMSGFRRQSCLTFFIRRVSQTKNATAVTKVRR